MKASYETNSKQGHTPPVAGEAPVGSLTDLAEDNNTTEVHEANTPLDSRSEGAEDEYEAPAVFDMGKVFDVTLGSCAGAGDSNGQAHY